MPEHPSPHHLPDWAEIAAIALLAALLTVGGGALVALIAGL